MVKTGRPIEHWYIHPTDIDGVCDLEYELSDYVRSKDIESENLLSLLLFTAENLKPRWRTALRKDVTLGKLSQSKSLPANWKATSSTREPASESREPRWTITTEAIMEALGVSQNLVHLTKHQGRLDPGRLLSLLRFAMFRARPKTRAAIIQALFQDPE